MRKRTSATIRRGSILPFLASSLVALCGFAALSVDLGMIMVAKTQVPNAADAAAFAGARTLTWATTTSDTTIATTNAQNAATANTVLNQPIS